MRPCGLLFARLFCFDLSVGIRGDTPGVSQHGVHQWCAWETGGVGWEPGGDDAPCLVAVGDDQAPLADGGESLAEPVLVYGAAQSHE